MLWLLVSLLQAAPPAPPAQPVSLPRMPIGMRIQTAAPAPVKITDAKQIDGLLGKQVQIEGVAADAKIGAIVLADGFSAYLTGKPGWSDAERGKRVRVIGVLSRTDAFKAEETPSGISQGTAGGDLVIAATTVELID